MNHLDIIFIDCVKEYRKKNDNDFSFSDIISYNSINIFKEKIITQNITKKDIDTILIEIFSNDKVDFLDLILSENLLELDEISNFFKYRFKLLKDQCLYYLVKNNIFPYDLFEDHFLLEAIYNENFNSLKLLIEIYNEIHHTLSKQTIQTIQDFNGDISFIIYFLDHFVLSEEEFSCLLKPNPSFFQTNENQKYIYFEIINSALDKQFYYLIDETVFLNCLYNDNYESAKLIINLNIPISINYNSFLIFSIYHEDKDTFYKIINHTNFNNNFINNEHFEPIFGSDTFDLNDYKYLIDKYLINICIDYEEKIEDYDINFYKKLHEVTLSSIEYNKYDFFVYLYNLSASRLFYKYKPKYKEELLKKSLTSYSISNYLFIENKEPVYLQYSDEFIVEYLESPSSKIAKLILDIKEVNITENAILKAIINVKKKDDINFLTNLLNHEKINKLENLNFALLNSSHIDSCPQSFSLLWNSDMTYIDNDNYKDILNNLIKSGNYEGFVDVVNSDFMKSVSLNDFAYLSVKNSKHLIFEFIMNDKRFTSLNDLDSSPYNAILNKTINSFDWNPENNYKILELILGNKHLNINSKTISLLFYAVYSNNFDLFKNFLNRLNKEHLKLWTEELNKIFIDSLVYKNTEFPEFLFYNSFIDLSLIEEKVLRIISLKKHNRKFIIDLLKNINNAPTNSLFYFFKNVYLIDFDIASTLFRKNKLKRFIIDKDKKLYDSFNKIFISKNMSKF